LKEERNSISSKLAEASFNCEDLKIKLKDRKEHCTKLESSLYELKEEVGCK